ncbi:MAG: thiamine phosphate synthase [Methylophilaceae bacterium]|nr:thiamine phosphate synthase [Methylophilaceae bacterium]
MATKTTRVNSSIVAGLYAVTPDLADTQKLCELVEASLLGGAAIVQYRNKSANPELREQQAAALLSLCHKYSVPLIINDFLDLCISLDADGVHMGADDGDLAEARERLGSDKLLGVSCYNRYELAEQARAMKADYVAFGACYASGTKPAAFKAPLELIVRAHASIGLPVVAIGGITLDNATQLIQAGADSVAVVGALFSGKNVTAEHVTQTAKQFFQLFI